MKREVAQEVAQERIRVPWPRAAWPPQGWGRMQKIKFSKNIIIIFFNTALVQRLIKVENWSAQKAKTYELVKLY